MIENLTVGIQVIRNWVSDQCSALIAAWRAYRDDLDFSAASREEAEARMPFSRTSLPGTARQRETDERGLSCASD